MTVWVSFVTMHIAQGNVVENEKSKVLHYLFWFHPPIFLKVKLSKACLSLLWGSVVEDVVH